MKPTLPRWRLALAAAVVAGYAGLSHWLMLNAGNTPWAIAAIWGPLLLALSGWALARRQAVTLALTLAALVTLFALAVKSGAGDINRLYLLQHAGMHVGLAWGFAPNWRGPRRSLIVTMARRVHAALTPAMEVYAHRVSGVWALYFLAMAGTSILIYNRCPFATWSLFANVATPLAAAALFVGEHALRYWLHPEFERASIADAVRAYSTWRPGRDSPLTQIPTQ